jgi:hypothetical protein
MIPLTGVWIFEAFYLPDQGTDKINIDGAFYANEMNKVWV